MTSNVQTALKVLDKLVEESAKYPVIAFPYSAWELARMCKISNHTAAKLMHEHKRLVYEDGQWHIKIGK